MKSFAHRFALLTFALTGCAGELASVSRAQTAETKSPQSTNALSPGTSAKEKTDSVENQARAALLAGDAEKAVAILDPYLAANPKARSAWILRALASEKAGNSLAASAIVDYIQRDFDPAKGPPPPDIRTLQARFQKSRAQQMKAAPADIPKWSWPPAIVLPAVNLESTSANIAGQPSTSSSTSTSTPTTTRSQASAPAALPTLTSAPLSTSSSASQTPGAPTTATSTKDSDGKAAELGAGSVVDPKTLSDAAAKSDSHGQWATSAKASSEYGSPGYAATQITGLPDVAQGGDDTHAWCASSSAHTPQWIEATFSKPVFATEVRIRQSYNPGAIVKVEAIDAEGASHLWWQGVDPARPPGALNAIAWFAVRVPKTSYRVVSIRVTLDVDAVASWQEIDAIQLVGAEQ